MLEYEFGADISNEFESAARAQLRYLHGTAFEPAVEIYLDDQDHAAGPAVLGALRLSGCMQLRWEAGAYFALDSRTPTRTARVSFEFEF